MVEKFNNNSDSFDLLYNNTNHWVEKLLRDPNYCEDKKKTHTHRVKMTPKNIVKRQSDH
jgi:hypothetical protein